MVLKVIPTILFFCRYCYSFDVDYAVILILEKKKLYRYSYRPSRAAFCNFI